MSAQKYGPCDCNAFGGNGEKSVIQAAAIARIAPGSMFSNQTVAFIMTAKYADGLPFHRQEKVVARLGVGIAWSTMARLAIRVVGALAPVIERLQLDIRGSPVVGMDETVLQVLKEPDRKPTSESRMWVARGFRDRRPILLFVYDQSRSGSVVTGLLGDGFKGFLQTDGYSGYNEMGQRPGVIHVGCWAHVRRRFHHLCDPKSPGSFAFAAIDLIGELYGIERKLRDRLGKGLIDEAGFFIMRKEECTPVFGRIKTWLLETLPRVPLKSPIGEAISYALGQFDRAVRYVDHPLLTPNNNPVENAIRPFVIGRKNWLFADTPNGAWASATLYSLIETARANGHEPYRYLCHLFDRLPVAGSDADIAALMPYVLDPTDPATFQPRLMLPGQYSLGLVIPVCRKVGNSTCHFQLGDGCGSRGPGHRWGWVKDRPPRASKDYAFPLA